MNRRLVLSLVTGTIVVAGLTGSALADTTASHKVCVGDATNNAGWCVVWDDPATTVGGILPKL